MNSSKKAAESKRLLNDDERACCEKEPADGAPTEDGCVESWSVKIVEAKGTMMVASAESARAEKRFENAWAWEQKLGSWIRAAEKAGQNADSVVDELRLFLEAVGRLRTEMTAEAIEALLCLVKCVFDDIHELLRVGNTDEDPGQLQNLKQKVECFGEIDDDKKAKAVECIDEYGAKVSAAYKHQDDLMKSLLDLLYVANSLTASIEQSGDDRGLKWQLNDLYQRLNGDSSNRSEHRCGEPSDPSPCGQDISEPPSSKGRSLFPIPESVYLEELRKLSEAAREQTKSYRVALAGAKLRRDQAQTRYDSLAAAIEAAKAAEEAK